MQYFRSMTLVRRQYDVMSGKKAAAGLEGKTPAQCLHRWQKVLRPGLIFSEREPLTLGAAALFQAFTPETVELEPPLHVETVARAALHASLDEETSGVLDVAAIRALAARSAASC